MFAADSSSKPEDTEPMWLKDEELKDFEKENLEEKENTFFRDLIKEYLSPLEKNEEQEEKVSQEQEEKVSQEQEERVSQELKRLRNKCIVAFFLMNIVFVVMVFTIQIQNVKDGLYIPWPCGENLKIEPIGLMFIVLFGFVLVLQTVGMIIHRMETFLHIMASTVICGNGNNNNNSVNSIEVPTNNVTGFSDDKTSSDTKNHGRSRNTTSTAEIYNDNITSDTETPALKQSDCCNNSTETEALVHV